MKVTAPNDLHGRLIDCEYRSKALAFALDAMAHAHDELGPPDSAVLTGLAAIADELSDELVAVQDVCIARSNEKHGGKGGAR